MRNQDGSAFFIGKNYVEGNISMEKEQRNYEAVELRVEGDTTPAIRGYAAVFNSMSEDLGYFREIVSPGAFSKTLNDGADVRALFNHNPDFVIGRTKSGTLKLKEDNRGLFTDATIPETTWAKDLVVSIKRGDVSQMSFGFHTIKDSWENKPDGKQIRTLLEVRLLDVSPVTYPAYPDTSVGVRALLKHDGVDLDKAAEIMLRMQHNKSNSQQTDKNILESTIESLRQFLLKCEPGNHSSDGGNEKKSQVRNLASFRRKLELAEKESSFNKNFF